MEKLKENTVSVRQVELEQLPCGLSLGTQGTCITVLVPLCNVFLSREQCGGLWNPNGENYREIGKNFSEKWRKQREWRNVENEKNGEKWRKL